MRGESEANDLGQHAGQLRFAMAANADVDLSDWVSLVVCDGLIKGRIELSSFINGCRKDTDELGQQLYCC